MNLHKKALDAWGVVGTVLVFAFALLGYAFFAAVSAGMRLADGYPPAQITQGIWIVTVCSLFVCIGAAVLALAAVCLLSKWERPVKIVIVALCVLAVLLCAAFCTVLWDIHRITGSGLAFLVSRL